MTHRIILAAIATALGGVLLAGCPGDIDPAGSGNPMVAFFFGDDAGTRRPLPAASFSEAFSAGRTVLSHYFHVASADADDGIIRSEPQFTDRSGGLLGRSGNRRVAMLKITHVGGQLMAVASVAVQRKGVMINRERRAYQDNYDSVPNQTPADMDAATTSEQNEMWETHSYDHALENQILDDLIEKLGGAGDTETP